MSQPLQSCLWVLLELFALLSFAESSDMSLYHDDPPLVHIYNRLPEIEKVCSPFLSSASELKPGDASDHKIRNELSFFNGDWMQELGISPLVPFDDNDLTERSSSSFSPPRLVDFEVKDVNPIHQLRNAVSLRGTMCIGMARNSSLGCDSGSNFYMEPGMSVLKIAFEGVYIETGKGGGQRLLCMLGNTTLPLWNSAPATPLSNNLPRLEQDDRLLLVLHYPQAFSLTRRATLGELRSLNEPGKTGYFDAVRISSQLSPSSRYEFSSEKLKSRTCDFSLLKWDLEQDGLNRFSNNEFCFNLQRFSGFLAPNWRFVSTGRLGPFRLGWGANDTSHINLGLVLQNLKCEVGQTGQTMTASAKVAAVFRAFPAEEPQDIASRKTGLSNLALSVEGTWDASEGHLCLVGCSGVSSSGLEGCDSQISLYFPHSFSINRRSIIFGSISSVSSEGHSYDPVLIELEMPRPSDFLFELYSSSYLLYNYSKIEQAEDFRKRSQHSGLVNLIKPIFLSYPLKKIQLLKFVTNVKTMVMGYSVLQKSKDEVFTNYEMHSLSYDLSILGFGTPVSSRSSHKPEIFFQLEVLPFGPLATGLQGPSLQEDTASLDDQAKLNVSKSEVLNVSLSLMFTQAPHQFIETDYKNISKLSLEGVYDPLAGVMHLIGCRKVTVQATALNGLERSLDCLIEIKVEYPAEALRWLINPRAEITVTSQRSKDDSLYFHPIQLQTSVLRYNNHEKDAAFRKIFEEILRNLMIIVSIAFISSQLLYIKKNVDGIRYISIIMLSFQSLDYIFPLLSNAKFLLQEKEYQPPYNLHGYDRVLDVLNYSGKFLALAAFVMNIILTRKANELRNQPQNPGSSWKMAGVGPKYTRARLIIALVFLLGFLIYCYLCLRFLDKEDLSLIGDAQLKRIWAYKTQEFIGFIQDIFLLPQIAENMISQTPFRPLRKLYYIGFTAMRVSAHLYDLIRDPVVNPYSYETAFVNLDLLFKSTAANLAVVVIMVGLAVVLYLQQERSHQKFIQQQETVTAKSM